MRSFDSSTSNLKITLVTVATILLVWLAGAGVIIEDEESRRANRVNQANNVSLLFEQHTLRMLLYADTYLRAARLTFLNSGSIESVKELLQRAPLDKGILSHISIFGTDGVPVLVSGKKIKPGTHARDRQYFQFQKTTPGDQLYLSKPIKGRNSGKITMRLVRRIQNQAGDFKGVIFAAVSVPGFVEFFDQLKLSKNSSFMLIGLDKIVRAHTDYDNLPAVINLDSSLLWKQAAEDPVGQFSEVNPIDGIERIYVYRKIPDFDLIVVSGIANSEHWELALPVTVIIILATLLIIIIGRINRRGLEEANKFASSILGTATDAILMADQHGIVISINPAAESIFQTEHNDAIGKPISELIPEIEFDTTEGKTILQKESEAQKAGDFAEVLGVMPDGTKFPILLSMFKTSFAREDFLTCIVHDLSARKMAEQRLLESEVRFKDFARVASDWFWEMDSDLRFSYFSERFSEVALVNPKELLGKTREETGIPNLSPDLWQEHLDNLHNRRTFRGFVHPRRKSDGTTAWLSISGLPVFDSEGEFSGFRGVGSDITSAVESERELIMSKEKAEKASNAKTDFLSSMSHELRTPMNAILGFSQILLRNDSDILNEKQRTYVEQIEQAGDHLLKLITDILELNKIDNGVVDLVYEVIRLDEIVDYCIGLQLNQAKSLGLEINKIEMIGGYPQVNLDRTRLTQIVLNILSNAVKYNEKGGKVTIECETTPAGNIKLLISDTGSGISEDSKERMFEPFDRLGREFGEVEGSGIGMTISRRLANLLDCEIDFESEQGVGTRFWIEFPAAAVVVDYSSALTNVKSIEAVECAMEPEATESPLILYVEDNPTNQLLMKSIAKLLPEVRLIIADDAESGIEIAEKMKPRLILLDINLPGMNGIEAAMKLRESAQTREIPIVAVSSDAMDFQIENALAAGIDQYLTKPLKIDQVIDVIRKYNLNQVNSA